MAIFILILAYASGLPLFIVAVLKQLHALPGLDNDLFWLSLFPISMGQFKDDTSVGIDLCAPNYLILALPFFVLAIGWEAFVLFYVVETPPRHLPRINDTMTSLSLGILNQIITVVIFLNWAKPLYELIHEHLGITDPSADSPLAWWSCLIAYDCFYYWWHRSSHYISWLWTDHVVHHSSEEYNLATALRQPFNAFATPDQLVSLMPCALFFPWPLASMHASLSLLYQFWIHTSLIPPTPTFELVFNSASLHRIHHVRNQDQLGKNFGAILSVWDRWFGTFLSEPRPDNVSGPVETSYYGVIPPLHSFNPLWANMHHWHYILTTQSKWHGWNSLITHWTPPGAKCPAIGMKMNPRTKYDATPRDTALWLWLPYATVQFVFAFAVTAVGNLAFDSVSDATKAVLGLKHQYAADIITGVAIFFVVLWSLCAVASALEITLDSSAEVLKTEVVRHAIVLVIVAAFVVHGQPDSIVMWSAIGIYGCVQGVLLLLLYCTHRSQLKLKDEQLCPDQERADAADTIPPAKAWSQKWYDPLTK